jgi:hypothetical protein
MPFFTIAAARSLTGGSIMAATASSPAPGVAHTCPRLVPLVVLVEEAVVNRQRCWDNRRVGRGGACWGEGAVTTHDVMHMNPPGCWAQPDGVHPRVLLIRVNRFVG